MKLYFGLLLALHVALAVDELDEAEYKKILGSEVWKEIKKSLFDTSKKDALGDDYDFYNTNMNRNKDPSCNRLYKSDEGFIIRTHESIANGAIFIESPGAKTREDCLSECCKQSECNLAVFEDKSKRSCYLFDCKVPSLCTFTNHTGYISMHLNKESIQKAVVAENALQGLVDNSPLTPPTKEKATEAPLPPKTNPPTTSTTTTTTTQAPPIRRPVELFGTCYQGDTCVDKHAVCSLLLGYCICADGYHNKGGFCVHDCNKFQYECENQEQRIDPDDPKVQKIESGNINPEPKTSNTLTSATNSKSAPEHTAPGSANPPDSSEISSEVDEKPEVGDKESDKDMIIAPDEDEASNSNEEKEESKNTKNTDIIPKDGTNPIETKNSENIYPSSEVNDNDTPKNISMTHPNDSEESPEGEDIVEEKKEADIYEQISESKGAVIALSLGLCITVLLLFYVGCRLRRVQSRLRRGKPMNSNEADYLINGMYL